MNDKIIVPATKKRKRQSKKYTHESFCLICWDGGKLLCCDLCPASYHKSYLQDHGYVFSLKKGFKCPHHNCVKCGRGNGQAGGLLLRCTCFFFFLLFRNTTSHTDVCLFRYGVSDSILWGLWAQIMYSFGLWWLRQISRSRCGASKYCVLHSVHGTL